MCGTGWPGQWPKPLSSVTSVLKPPWSQLPNFLTRRQTFADAKSGVFPGPLSWGHRVESAAPRFAFIPISSRFLYALLLLVSSVLAGLMLKAELPTMPLVVAVESLSHVQL